VTVAMVAFVFSRRPASPGKNPTAPLPLQAKEALRGATATRSSMGLSSLASAFSFTDAPQPPSGSSPKVRSSASLGAEIFRGSPPPVSFSCCELIQLAEMAAASASRVLTAGSSRETGTSSATSPRESASAALSARRSAVASTVTPSTAGAATKPSFLRNFTEPSAAGWS
jgi:hypothetical protein